MIYVKEKLLSEGVVLLFFLCDCRRIQFLNAVTLGCKHEIPVIIEVAVVPVICDDREHSCHYRFYRHVVSCDFFLTGYLYRKLDV